jgi:hypothetical protein
VFYLAAWYDQFVTEIDHFLDTLGPLSRPRTDRPLGRLFVPRSRDGYTLPFTSGEVYNSGYIKT